MSLRNNKWTTAKYQVHSSVEDRSKPPVRGNRDEEPSELERKIGEQGTEGDSQEKRRGVGVMWVRAWR